MILVVLGTQDKKFTRLLKAVEREIKKGNIKDRVVVQAGQTDYKSDVMEIFDLMSAPEFDKLMDEADIVITHGGAGTILTAIKKGKKIIAAARLAKYKEDHNDHQKQIIKEFADQGYLLELKDFNKLDELLKKIKTFKPKKFESNTPNMIKLLEEYIEDTNNTSWFNKSYEVLSYLFFGGCTTLVNIISFWLLRLAKIELYTSNGLAWLIAVLFAFVTNKLFVFESKGNFLKEMVSFFIFRVISLLFDMGIMYLLIDVINFNELASKIISNVFVIVINYLFSKMFIFKK